MGIKKMNLVTVVGPESDYDDIVKNHICDKCIHLENAMSALDNVTDLKPFDAVNPYAEKYKEFSSLLEGYEIPKCSGEKTETADAVDACLKALSDKKGELSEKMAELENTISADSDVLTQLEPIMSLDMDLSTLRSFEFIKLKFGKLPKDSYKKLNLYLDNLQAVFVYGQEDRDYVWGMYFTLESYREKVEKVFASLYFEPIEIDGKWSGTAKEVKAKISDEMSGCKKQLSEYKKQYSDYIKQNGTAIASCFATVEKYYTAGEMRRYCARDNTDFYLTGWVDGKTLKKIEKEFGGDDRVMVSYDSAKEAPKHLTPPTCLVNNPVFRPFEFFIKMYGLPSYNEIDPTPIVALTYILMFGIMFGDAGQGLVMAIGGFLLYKFKKVDLAAIIGMVGVSSTVFGLLYGSVFGFEDVIRKTVLIRPMDNIMTMLISAVAFGVVIIVMAMLVNLANAIKQKNVGKLLFSQNGIAGMLFYLAVIFGVVMMLFKRNVFTVVYNIIFIVIPLVLIMFQSPLSRLIEKKKKLFDGSKGEFILENIFELFDIVLSFITNTISFVRVGAFALNHVGMMSVVFIFAKMASGATSTVVIIIGNIIVMGLEGLIVGIQVLRLEFYEIFSRFYDGGGKEFKTISKN